MKEKRMQDLISATGEETVDFVLSEVLPNVISTYGGYVVSEGIAALAGSLIGAVCPRANSAWLSYKQKRLERNVSIMIGQLIAENDSLSARISALEASLEGRTLINRTGELLLDGIVDEIEEEKVKFEVNAFINLLKTDDVNMDMSMLFFKTLNELNVVDICVLTAYGDGFTIARREEIEKRFKFDYEQLNFVEEKLYRLGLLKSRNEESSRKNQQKLIDYLKKVDRNTKSRNARSVSFPLFQKVYSSDSYSTTKLGRALLQLISEQCDLSNIENNEPEREVEHVE